MGVIGIGGHALAGIDNFNTAGFAVFDKGILQVVGVGILCLDDIGFIADFTKIARGFLQITKKFCVFLFLPSDLRSSTLPRTPIPVFLILIYAVAT